MDSLQLLENKLRRPFYMKVVP